MVTDVLAGLSTSERLLQGLKYSLIGFITVICVLLLIAGFTIVLSKIISKIEKSGKKKATENVEKSAQVQAADSAKTPTGKALDESESQGTLKLIDVDDETAAIIMALISDETKIPLNRLEFKQIKLLGEEEK